MYTPNNLSIYLSAIQGAMAGMAASDRNPTNPSPLAYASQAAIADAFAQAFDGLIPPSPQPLPESLLPVAVILCYAVWQDRSPIVSASSILPATYVPLATSLAGITTALFTQVASQGVSLSEGDVTAYSPDPTFANLAGDAVLGNGTLTGFYKHTGDTLSIFIQLVAGATTDYGTDSTLIVPLPAGYAVDTSKMNPGVALPFSFTAQGWPSSLAGIAAGVPAAFPYLLLYGETSPTVFNAVTLIPVSGLATPGDAFLYSVIDLPIILI
jgi:hypothetical protein